MNRKKFLVASVLFAMAFGVGAAPALAEEDPRVAYVEEETYEPDGTRRVERYRAGQEPVAVEGPAVRQPRQRGLNTVERDELMRLEEAFAHGKISESEYNQRKRSIWRSTFVDGAPEDDGLFNQSFSF